MDRAASELDAARYYRAAALGLRYLEGQKPTGRRFGPDADARWASFRGDLTTADRLDLMIRDADAQWPGSLGARTTFAARAVAEDEPFGPNWISLDPVDAEDLWRAVTTAPPAADVRALLAAVAAAWELALPPFDSGPIAPADKLTLVGPAAIAATLVAFASGRDLDWSDQVTVIATPPAHRQLAALAGALLGATRPTRLLTAAADRLPPRRGRLVLSPDADPADARRAQEPA